MEMLKKGDDPYFYSMALKDYRKEFVRRHFVWLLLGAAAGLTLFIFLIKKAHRWMLSGKPANESVADKAERRIRL